MKLRLLPVVVTLVVSSSLLFGGWFVYQSVAMEDPFLKQVEAIEGVAGSHLDIGRTEAIVSVQLDETARLGEVYRNILKAGDESLGSRKVIVEAQGEASDALEAWWSKALFDVAQAMETKQYAMIPERLQALASDGMTVETEMDDTNVYISLKDGEASKFVILPRTPALMGVWPNE
ncbi:hypothetical protein MO973_08785 [Paenibacillus sp. TRM 82003]|nr:hypothetical protein [Paenibacillus sp. TRM 82003]